MWSEPLLFCCITVNIINIYYINYYGARPDSTVQYLYVSAEISIERVTSGANEIHTQYYIFYVCCSGSRTPCKTQKHFLIQIKSKKWTNCTIIKWLFFVGVNIKYYLVYRYLHITMCSSKVLVVQTIQTIHPIYLYTSLSI